eukprot:TRINITY_DN3276_c0_g1_i1.p1 TRINITY_DN3276_c0_g1~~TRINITY_DN3276_c0_g1_i1.p1  ORF type:complete len:288 (-),score=48.28 TRINITY_DN3276_c0_g1_i1:170-1033(-)
MNSDYYGKTSAFGLLSFHYNWFSFLSDGNIILVKRKQSSRCVKILPVCDDQTINKEEMLKLTSPVFDGVQALDYSQPKGFIDISKVSIHVWFQIAEALGDVDTLSLLTLRLVSKFFFEIVQSTHLWKEICKKWTSPNMHSIETFKEYCDSHNGTIPNDLSWFKFFMKKVLCRRIVMIDRDVNNFLKVKAVEFFPRSIIVHFEHTEAHKPILYLKIYINNIAGDIIGPRGYSFGQYKPLLFHTFLIPNANYFFQYYEFRDEVTKTVHLFELTERFVKENHLEHLIALQ